MRLDEVADQLGPAVVWEHRSFLLRPEPEPRPLDKFTEYTKNWARPAEMEPKARFRTWSGEHQPPSHSVPAAVAGKVAETFGAEAHHAFQRRALEAYFAENRTISDRDVLVTVASEAGLDAAEFARRWEEGEKGFVRAVYLDYTLAVNSGITAVPSVVVDHRYLVQGGVEVVQYLEVIDRARAERP